MKKIILLISLVLGGYCMNSQQILNESSQIGIVSIDWGVYTEDDKSKTKFCDPYSWICKLTLFKMDDISEDNSYILKFEKGSLYLSFKNSILNSEEYSRLFGGEILDFNSGGKFEYYTLSDDICEKLNLPIGFKIYANKYPIDKSIPNFTTINLSQNQ